MTSRTPTEQVVERQCWRRINELFDPLLFRARSDRDEFLRENCGDDLDLRAELESLLAAHERAPLFLEQPALDVSVLEATQDAAAIEAGRLIGAYTICGVLGRGGMGIVYEAEQKNPRRMVALKVMRSLPYQDELTSRLFTREVQALARLEHPGIAAVYDAGTTAEGWHYFAMERVHGDPLVDHARRRLSLSKRLQLFAQVCDAVHYAHQRGVIHRDLKPSNVLATARGETKVLDFGLARIMGPDAEETLVTRTGAFHGTLAYASPEQVAGRSNDIDVRSDVYSLGVVLFEMLTGRLPYELQGLPFADAAKTVCERPAPPPSSVSTRDRTGHPRHDRINDEVDTIVLKCLAKERDRRYQTAADVARDVRHYLAGRPIEARRDSRRYLARKWLWRHRIGVTLAGMAVMLLALGAAAMIQHQRSVQSRERLAVQSWISALRSAALRPEQLAEPESPASLAAQEIWQRIEQGEATAEEIRELAEASVRMDFMESSMFDMTGHALLNGGFYFNYATRVYACPKGLGFLINPHFRLDAAQLPVLRAWFQAETPRLDRAHPIPALTTGPHLLTVELDATPARVRGPADYVPIAPSVTIPAGACRFTAVVEHPPEYPTALIDPLYQESVAAQLVIERAALVARQALPRQAAAPAIDELEVVMAFPAPAVDLAGEVEVWCESIGVARVCRFALSPGTSTRPAAVVYSDCGARLDAGPERWKLSFRVSALSLLIDTNPENLIGASLAVDWSPSRGAARAARFERFLGLALSRNVIVVDARPPLRRQAGALAYPLLDELIAPRLVEERLDQQIIDAEVLAEALRMTKEAGAWNALHEQAWAVVAEPEKVPEAYERALTRAREACRLAPDVHQSYHILGAALYRVGAHDMALDALRRALDLSNEHRISKLALLAMAEHCGGWTAEADVTVSQLDDELKANPFSFPLSRRHAHEANELIEGRRECPRE